MCIFVNDHKALKWRVETWHLLRGITLKSRLQGTDVVTTRWKTGSVVALWDFLTHRLKLFNRGEIIIFDAGNRQESTRILIHIGPAWWLALIGALASFKCHWGPWEPDYLPRAQLSGYSDSLSKYAISYLFITSFMKLYSFKQPKLLIIIVWFYKTLEK